MLVRGTDGDGLAFADPYDPVMRAAVRSWVRPGSVGEIRSSLPAGIGHDLHIHAVAAALRGKSARLSPTRSHSASVPSSSTSSLPWPATPPRVRLDIQHHQNPPPHHAL
ncbi:hypothetical protein SY2F82_38600 [Streptomyces sp. Y2F8-2]|nr:hypothetical protein SY2F82_38600 [Streptomyces sp. Y2F8-2]